MTSFTTSCMSLWNPFLVHAACEDCFTLRVSSLFIIQVSWTSPNCVCVCVKATGRYTKVTLTLVVESLPVTSLILLSLVYVTQPRRWYLYKHNPCFITKWTSTHHKSHTLYQESAQVMQSSNIQE